MQLAKGCSSNEELLPATGGHSKKQKKTTHFALPAISNLGVRFPIRVFFPPPTSPDRCQWHWRFWAPNLLSHLILHSFLGILASILLRKHARSVYVGAYILIYQSFAWCQKIVRQFARRKITFLNQFNFQGSFPVFLLYA